MTNSTSTPTQRPSWPDSPAVDEFLSSSEVYRAVVASRNLTLEHLRQIPAEEILSRHEPEVALKILLDHCGRSTDRWRALVAAMSTTKRRPPSESSSSPWTALPPERRHPD
ncbi:hypothetical protein AB0N62_34745 [Streptomyces sp. NPDC093982]|uniref:hypothetical protein n=1 Tax=Streptomyces sp. NPDC093982 TaxID=3155077 RepID=UPI00343FA702